MRVECERLYLYPISDDEMRCLIDKEADTEMNQAFSIKENVYLSMDLLGQCQSCVLEYGLENSLILKVPYLSEQL